jgi:hypothetical protein
MSHVAPSVLTLFSLWAAVTAGPLRFYLHEAEFEQDGVLSVWYSRYCAQPPSECACACACGCATCTHVGLRVSLHTCRGILALGRFAPLLRACVLSFVRAFVHSCVHSCVRSCVRACVGLRCLRTARVDEIPQV